MTPLRLVVAAGLVVAVAGCGDPAAPATAPDTTPGPTISVTAPTLPDTTSPTTIPATTSTTPATLATTPSTTGPEMTLPATTMLSTTTVLPTTAPEPQRTGWEPSDFRPAAFVLGYSGNWDGPPSPPAPADPTQAPANGYYVATLRRPWAPGDTQLQVTVHRLEYCTLIPGGCEYYREGTNETNLDPAWSLDVEVPLNATSRVVLTGFSCRDDSDQQTKAATGSDLASLFESFAADYDQAIRPLVLANVDEQEISEAVAASPTGGFVGEVAHCGEGDNGFAGPLRYVHADAPVLLLQSVRRWVEDDRFEPMVPTDLIGLQGVEYRDGIPTFFFYAGFYS